jgi:hypothetical protein
MYMYATYHKSCKCESLRPGLALVPARDYLIHEATWTWMEILQYLEGIIGQ